MRFSFLVVTLLCLTISLFGYDFLGTDKAFSFDVGEGYVVKDHRLYFVSVEDLTKTTEIKLDEIVINQFGYIEAAVNDKTIIIIPGEGHSETFGKGYLKSQNFLDAREKRFPSVEIQYRARIGVSSLESSSYYSERLADMTIEYRSEYLLDRFFADCVCHPLNFNHHSTPWVEGVTGDGVGESLMVNLSEPSDHVSVLNGYVDLMNQNLFYENGRLKTVKVTSKNPSFEVTHEFDDYVYFSEITFPSKTNEVVIEILDVYPGSKYNDTSVSGLVSRNFAVNHDIESEAQMWGFDMSLFE